MTLIRIITAFLFISSIAFAGPFEKTIDDIEDKLEIICEQGESQSNSFSSIVSNQLEIIEQLGSLTNLEAIAVCFDELKDLNDSLLECALTIKSNQSASVSNGLVVASLLESNVTCLIDVKSNQLILIESIESSIESINELNETLGSNNAFLSSIESAIVSNGMCLTEIKSNQISMAELIISSINSNQSLVVDAINSNGLCLVDIKDLLSSNGTCLVSIKDTLVELTSSTESNGLCLIEIKGSLSSNNVCMAEIKELLSESIDIANSNAICFTEMKSNQVALIESTESISDLLSTGCFDVVIKEAPCTTQTIGPYCDIQIDTGIEDNVIISNGIFIDIDSCTGEWFYYTLEGTNKNEYTILGDILGCDDLAEPMPELEDCPPNAVFECLDIPAPFITILDNSLWPNAPSAHLQNGEDYEIELKRLDGSAIYITLNSTPYFPSFKTALESATDCNVTYGCANWPKCGPTGISNLEKCNLTPDMSELWANGWIIKCGGCESPFVKATITKANNPAWVGISKDMITRTGVSTQVYKSVNCSGVFWMSKDGKQISEPDGACCAVPCGTDNEPKPIAVIEKCFTIESGGGEEVKVGVDSSDCDPQNVGEKECGSFRFDIGNATIDSIESLTGDGLTFENVVITDTSIEGEYCYIYDGNGPPSIPIIISVNTSSGLVLIDGNEDEFSDFRTCSGGGSTSVITTEGLSSELILKELCYDGMPSVFQNSMGEVVDTSELSECEDELKPTPIAVIEKCYEVEVESNCTTAWQATLGRPNNGLWELIDNRNPLNQVVLVSGDGWEQFSIAMANAGYVERICNGEQHWFCNCPDEMQIGDEAGSYFLSNDGETATKIQCVSIDEVAECFANATVSTFGKVYVKELCYDGLPSVFQDSSGEVVDISGLKECNEQALQTTNVINVITTNEITVVSTNDLPECVTPSYTFDNIVLANNSTPSGSFTPPANWRETTVFNYSRGHVIVTTSQGPQIIPANGTINIDNPKDLNVCHNEFSAPFTYQYLDAVGGNLAGAPPRLMVNYKSY